MESHPKLINFRVFLLDDLLALSKFNIQFFAARICIN